MGMTPGRRAWRLARGALLRLEALVFGGTLLIYLLTLAPGALGGDAGELQFVPIILSLPHPTGVPLYILLGKLWSLLPLGASIAWRMNLLAATSAATAVTLVYHSVVIQEGNPWAALAGALSLAFTLTFWEQAILADKYAFNALMMALVLGLALRWGASRSPRALDGLAVVYGLSLAHHRTMILAAPALLGYVSWLEKGAIWRDRKRLLRLILAFVAPLTLYLYLPWAAARGLPPGTWQPRTLSAWIAYLFDTGRTGLVHVDMSVLGERLAFYLSTLWRDFTPLGVVLGVGGAVAQWRRRRSDALLLLAIFLPQAFLAANHHVPRHWVYFIPSFLIFAMWIGMGIAALPLVRMWGARQRLWGDPRALFLLTGIILAGLLYHTPTRYISLRQEHLGYGALDPWRQTLKSGHMADRLGQAIASVELQAVILCDWEQATPLWHYQQVVGLRREARIVYPVERLDEAASWGRPLYIARILPGVDERWHVWAESPLIALRDAPTFDIPASATATDIVYGDLIALAGVRLGSPIGALHSAPDVWLPSQVVPLTVYWRALAIPVHDYSVSMRLYNEAGGEVVKVDVQHPVLGLAPTSRWMAGQVVADYYELQLPPDLASGRYVWGAILYRALPEGGWESLKVDAAGAEFGVAGALQVGAR